MEDGAWFSLVEPPCELPGKIQRRPTYSRNEEDLTLVLSGTRAMEADESRWMTFSKPMVIPGLNPGVHYPVTQISLINSYLADVSVQSRYRTKGPSYYIVTTVQYLFNDILRPSTSRRPSFNTNHSPGSLLSNQAMAQMALACGAQLAPSHLVPRHGAIPKVPRFCALAGTEGPAPIHEEFSRAATKLAYPSPESSLDGRTRETTLA